MVFHIKYRSHYLKYFPMWFVFKEIQGNIICLSAILYLCSLLPLCSTEYMTLCNVISVLLIRYVNNRILYYSIQKVKVKGELSLCFF